MQFAEHDEPPLLVLSITPHARLNLVRHWESESRVIHVNVLTSEFLHTCPFAGLIVEDGVTIWTTNVNNECNARCVMYQLMVHWLHAVHVYHDHSISNIMRRHKKHPVLCIPPQLYFTLPNWAKWVVIPWYTKTKNFIAWLHCDNFLWSFARWKEAASTKNYLIKNLSRNVPRTSPWLTPLFCLNQTVLCGFWHIWYTLRLLSDIFWHCFRHQIWHFWHPIHEACRKFWHPIWHIVSYVSFPLA